MKKLLLAMLAVAICVGTSVAASTPKQKTIKIADDAQFSGWTLKKQPMGKGSLSLSSCGTLSGDFNGLNVAKGKLQLKGHDHVITGEFSMRVYKLNKYDEKDLVGLPNLVRLIKKGLKYKCLEIVVKKGRFNGKPIVGEAKMYYERGAYYLEVNRMFAPKVSSELVNSIKQIVGENVSYKIGKANGVVKYCIDNKTSNRKVTQKATSVTLKYSSGDVAILDMENNSYKVTRPNGDIISVKNNKVESYKITRGKSVIENGKVTYTFENRNKYIGTVSGNWTALPRTISDLASFKGLSWAWADFKKYADDGRLIYADGKSEKVVDGLTETEIKALEAELKALRSNDKFVADGNRYVASCTITYRDGVVFHYSKTDNVYEYVYKNGDKLKLSGFLDIVTYKKMQATLVAPDLYSWDVDGKRVFDNGKLTIDIYMGDVSVKSAADSKGNFVQYNSSSNKKLALSWNSEYKYTFTNHPKYKLIHKKHASTPSLDVQLKNGNHFYGSVSLKYNENATCPLRNNAHIKKFGITIEDAPEMISEISFWSGEMHDASGKLVAVYEDGKANQEELKKAQLQEKIDKLVEKHPEYSWYINRDYAYYVGDYISIFFLSFSQGMPIGLIREFYGSKSLRLLSSTVVGGVKDERYRFYIGDGDYDWLICFSNGKLKWWTKY